MIHNITRKSAVILFLVVTIALTLVSLPDANAQSTRATYAFCGVVPNPTGVGQAVTLHVGITHQTSWPQPGWTDLSVTVTDPDGHAAVLQPHQRGQ